MCILCSVRAVSFGKVLGPFTLFRATRDYITSDGKDNWSKGYFGLGDTQVRWKSCPLTDPSVGMTDKELDSLIRNSPIEDRWWEFAEKSQEFSAALDKANIQDSWTIVEECKKEGYDQNIHGTNIAMWLFNHIANKMNKLPIPYDKD